MLAPGIVSFLVELRPVGSSGGEGGPKTYFQQLLEEARNGAGPPTLPPVTEEALRLLGSGYPELLVLCAEDSIPRLHNYAAAGGQPRGRQAVWRCGGVPLAGCLPRHAPQAT